jgi:diphosphomevalonate decarboxylase
MKAQFEGNSNIALVKYWGKKFIGQDSQHPINPSLSFTLKHAKTTMNIQWEVAKTFEVKRVVFAGVENLAFQKNLNKKLERLMPLFEWKSGAAIEIETNNTFPHSSGIASSASSMSCFAKFLYNFLATPTTEQLSSIARILSGSACRSLSPGFVAWEESGSYALEQSSVSALFQSICDCILIVDESQKSVSSSMGHESMQDHFFKPGRIAQANAHFQELKHILRGEDFHSFARLVESEALSLHALMMSARNPYTLLTPATWKLISLIQTKRKEAGWRVCFTLDAGPNIHLLYFAQDRNRVLDWVQRELISSDGAKVFLDDQIL